MTTLPLDVKSLLGELEDPSAEVFAGLPAGARMGHVHLKVARIAQTLDFYRDVLGFTVMAQLGSHAAFLSAGGYHHHVGANTWESADVMVPAPGAAALRHATIVLPDDTERDRVLERAQRSGQTAQESPDGPIIVTLRESPSCSPRIRASHLGAPPPRSAWL